MHAPRKDKWQEKLKRSRYLVGAILFHLALFFMIATLVIWPAPTLPPTAIFHSAAIKPPPPPPPPPPPRDAGGSPATADLTPAPVVVPIDSPPTVITTDNPIFTLEAPKNMNQVLNNFNNLTPQGVGHGTGQGGLGNGTGNGFGSATGSNNELTGYLYDLKQTQDKKPSGMDYMTYYKVLGQYVNSRWSRSILEPYFKSKTPLYTDSVAIPVRPSEEGPKAFNLEKEVQPAYWAVHYHGKVTVPKAGDYEFLGYGDNLLVVKIGNKLVLDAGWNSLVPDKPDLRQPLPYHWAGFATNDRFPVTSGLIKKGAIFHMEAGEPVDMDVLIGDDGGVCGFYLMVMKVGNPYTTLSDGTPVAPFFQLNNTDPPAFSGAGGLPPYSTTPEPWQGVDTTPPASSPDGN